MLLTPSVNPSKSNHVAHQQRLILLNRLPKLNQYPRRKHLDLILLPSILAPYPIKHRRSPLPRLHNLAPLRLAQSSHIAVIHLQQRRHGHEPPPQRPEIILRVHPHGEK